MVLDKDASYEQTKWTDISEASINAIGIPLLLAISFIVDGFDTQNMQLWFAWD